MEAVVFEGKEYIKASVLAARFRYTADYLGQLCRGKKVDARLVGRAWYINLDSLNQHRNARYKTVAEKSTIPSSEIPQEKPSNNYLSRIDVEPILKKKTVALLKKQTNGSLSEFSVKYEIDDHALIPHVNRSAVSRNVPILPAEAEKLKIDKDKASVSTAFKPEPLPEVYLRGLVKVSSLVEASDPDQVKEVAVPEEPKSIHEKPRQILVRKLKQLPVASSAEMVKSPVSPTVNINIQPRVVEITKAPVPAAAKKSVPISTERASAVLPKRAVIGQARAHELKVVTVPQGFKPQTVVESEHQQLKKKTASPNWLVPAFLFIAAPLAVGVIIGLRSEIQVGVGDDGEHYIFEISQLREKLQSCDQLCTGLKE